MSIISKLIEDRVFRDILDTIDAEARKDSKRLDWLSNSDTWFDQPCDGVWTPESWRQAIDAAIDAEERHELKQEKLQMDARDEY